MCKQNKKQKHQQKDAGKFFEFFRPDKNLTKSHSVDGVMKSAAILDVNSIDSVNFRPAGKVQLVDKDL